jgi:hypothetical protein
VLTKEENDAIVKLNLSKVFKKEQADWKFVIKSVLNLSDTLEIAILDLRYKYRDISETQNAEFFPIKFSQDFVDNYYKEDSQVDIWQGNDLEEAKNRIALKNMR